MPRIDSTHYPYHIYPSSAILSLAQIARYLYFTPLVLSFAFAYQGLPLSFLLFTFTFVLRVVIVSRSQRFTFFRRSLLLHSTSRPSFLGPLFFCRRSSKQSLSHTWCFYPARAHCRRIFNLDFRGFANAWQRTDQVSHRGGGKE